MTTYIPVAEQVTPAWLTAVLRESGMLKTGGPKCNVWQRHFATGIVKNCSDSRCRGSNSLYALDTAFCLPVNHYIHKSLSNGFSVAHLEDLQNQTIIFDNHSTTVYAGASIITIR